MRSVSLARTTTKGGAIIQHKRIATTLNRCGRVLALLAVLGAATASGVAQARSLHWDAVDVKAHLNADGSMNVVERQTLVFDGAWNNGERTFDLPWRTHIHLLSLRRIDPASGAGIDLTPGPLNAVDHYKWVRDDKLRWCIRLPGDPPFHHATRVYELDYRLSDFLGVEGDERFRFDHDFAFRDRPGEIRHFSLDFTADPVWLLPAMLPRHEVRRNLRPHQGVIGRFTLRYVGRGRPAAVSYGFPAWWLALAVAVGLIVILLLWRLMNYLRGRA